MIIPLTGNVNYSITLDPTVWIFDDRKILLEEAFKQQSKEDPVINGAEEAAKRWERAIHQHHKPPVNKSISKFEGEKILKNSYVMPIHDFIQHAQVKDSAKEAAIVTTDGEINVTLEELQNCYLLFAVNGKPLKEDGPVHFFYRDGSNQDAPIKDVKKIVIK